MTKEEKNEIHALELRTLADDPIDRIGIKVKDYNWLDKIRFRPKVREFVIYRVRVCNMRRCAEISYRMPELTGTVKDEMDLMNIIMPLIKNHRHDFLYLIAACLQNNSKEPKRSLIKFLDDNLHGDSLNELGATCLLNSGLMSFFSFALTLKGVSANIVEDQDADRVETPG